MAIFDPSQFKPDNLTLENFPLGRHVVFISDAKPHTSKSGSQAIEIDFYIHDPASPHKGRSLRFSKFWTSEKALPRLANLCRACATPVAAFDLSDPAAIEGALIDQILSIEAKAKTETYQGETRTRIEADRFQRISAEEARRLRDEYGPTMLPPITGDEDTAPKTAGYGGEGSSKPKGEGFGDDDIPF
jgi:hypothetical protein